MKKNLPNLFRSSINEYRSETCLLRSARYQATRSVPMYWLDFVVLERVPLIYIRGF
jgi:hypothetical protein